MNTKKDIWGGFSFILLLFYIFQHLIVLVQLCTSMIHGDVQTPLPSQILTKGI